MAGASTRTVRLRRRLVRELEQRGLIRSAQVRDAFLTVPRETFLSEFAAFEGLEAVYRDEAIPTKFDANGFAVSSSSQPAIMAEMLEQLALEPGMRVLEVGAGTGYNAALLAQIVGPSGAVTTIEIDPEVARGARAALRRGSHQVSVRVGDGRNGFPDRAPFDRIIVTASSEEIPRPWFDQLDEGGLLEVPLRINAAGAQVIPTLRKTQGKLEPVSAVCGGFMPMRSANDEGSVPSRPPCLIASDATGDVATPPLLQISGASVTTLSAMAMAMAKRRLR